MGSLLGNQKIGGRLSDKFRRILGLSAMCGLQGGCGFFIGLLLLVSMTLHHDAVAQTAIREQQQATQPIDAALQASAPLSECPPLRKNPVAATWCSLTQASPVLQSVQIIILGALGVTAIGRTLYVRRKRRATLLGGSVTKAVVNVENSRLTSITDDLGNGWLVAGFSGRLWSIDYASKVKMVSTESVGLVRCLVEFTSRDSVLIGADDGAIHVFNVRTSSFKRLAALGSPIYRLARASDRLFVAALGSGDVALVEIQHSPGQNDYSFRELWRTRAHAGSAFDILSVNNSFVSVGADGRFVEISTLGKIISTTQVTDCTIWSVTEMTKDTFILGCNDGNLVRIESGAITNKVKSHQAAVRLVLPSPRGQWCISLGKDRSVFATLANLSANVLLHRSRDYLYDGSISEDGQAILVCDGAGDVTKINFDRAIDNYDHATLAARIN